MTTTVMIPALLAGLTVLAAAIVPLDAAGVPLGPLRIAAGTILTVWLPGMALIAAARPKSLARPVAFVMAIPLSLAFDALVGVAFDHSPFGLRPGPLSAGVVAPTIAFLGVALVRSIFNREPDAVEDARRGGVLARIWATARQPLFWNAYALGASGVLTSGLGVVYWAVAARLFPPETVGINGALLSLVILLANVAQLNLRSGWARFVPTAGRHIPRLVGWGYAIALLVAAGSGFAVVAVLALAPELLPNVRLTPLLTWLFPASVVLWTAFVLQDHLLTALRWTWVVPVENAIFGIAKIGALAVVVGLVPDYGILVSWTVPTAVGVIAVSAWLAWSLIPRHIRSRKAQGDDVDLTAVARFVGVDYVASLFAIAATAILPSIVLGIAGASTSGHFYVVTLVGSAVQLLPTVMSTSLLVESAAGEARFERDAWRVIRQLALLLVPLIVVFVIGAPLILSVFGPSYASEGTGALQLYALAGVPYAISQLAFVKLRLERRLRIIVAAQAALAAMIIGGSLALLPRFGITGIGGVILVADSLIAVLLLVTELRPVLFRRPVEGAAAGSASTVGAIRESERGFDAGAGSQQTRGAAPPTRVRRSRIHGRRRGARHGGGRPP